MKKFILFAAAALLFSASCSDDYDDSALKNQIGQIEGDLDAVKSDLEALKLKVEGLNSTYRSLTGLLNGGVITNVVQVTEGEKSGYRFTVLTVVDPNADPMVTRSSEYTIWNGVDGEDGAPGTPGTPGTPGADGKTPSLGVERDADGRYYWTITIDGETKPLMDGENYIYTTGNNGNDGKDGANGLTPQLKIEEVEGTPTWFVGYDRNADGVIEGSEWTELGVFSGTVVGSSITVTEADGVVTIKQDGKPDITIPVVTNRLKINFFESDGTTPKDLSAGLHMTKNDVLAFTYTIEGGSDNAIVSAQVQNAAYKYMSVYADGGVIQINSGNANETAVVIVSVYDGINCLHTSFRVSSDVPTLTVAEAAPVAALLYSATTGYTATNTLSLDEVAPERLTINLTVGADATLPADAYTALSTVSIAQGQQTAELPITITDRSKLTAGQTYTLPVTLSSTNNVKIATQTITLTVTDTPAKIALTAENYTSPYGANGANGEGSSAELCDGMPTPHWGSVYWDSALPLSPYGVYIDVALPTNLLSVQFRYQTRANGANGRPTALALGVSTDGVNWQQVGTVTEGLPEDMGLWYSTECYSLPGYVTFSAVRFGVTVSNMGDLTTNPAASAALSELEIWGLY